MLSQKCTVGVAGWCYTFGCSESLLKRPFLFYCLPKHDTRAFLRPYIWWGRIGWKRYPNICPYVRAIKSSCGPIHEEDILEIDIYVLLCPINKLLFVFLVWKCNQHLWLFFKGLYTGCFWTKEQSRKFQMWQLLCYKDVHFTCPIFEMSHRNTLLIPY